MLIAFAIFAMGMGFGFLLVPIALHIEYKILCKKYGKEEADKIVKKWM